MSENNKFLGQGGIGYLWSKIKANFLSKDAAYSKEEVDTKFDELKEVATSGSYNDLTDKPTIPTKTSQLTNDSGFKTTDNNTTYTLSKSGSTIVLTGSDGQTSSVSDDNTTYNLSSFGVNATATELNYTDGVTSNIQTQLDGKAPVTHTHSSYANQNAFSNVVVGSTTIAADSITDSLTLEGSNVTLTPDATNDKVTIGITKANVTAALGYTPPTTDTKYTHPSYTPQSSGFYKVTVDGTGHVSGTSVVTKDDVVKLGIFEGLSITKQSNGSVTITVA